MKTDDIEAWSQTIVNGGRKTVVHGIADGPCRLRLSKPVSVDYRDQAVQVVVQRKVVGDIDLLAPLDGSGNGCMISRGERSCRQTPKRCRQSFLKI